MENCAGLVARELHLPTLLWGPRDNNFSNDIRYTDTQCGLFAMSKQLKRNNVKFSYIENCTIFFQFVEDSILYLIYCLTDYLTFSITLKTSSCVANAISKSS